MLRLYYAPNACSLAAHIALREAGLPFVLERVDFMRNKRLSDGRTLMDVNPKGCLPALVLEDGQVLTEGAVIVQYVADRAPDRTLAPLPGTFARVRLQEWLNFIATDLQKGIAPLYGLDTPEAYRPVARTKVEAKLTYLASELAHREYLLDRFSVADGYLFYVLRSFRRVTRQALPEVLERYARRIAERPAVKQALIAEGVSY